MTTPDPLAGLACPICGGPVSLQYSREHPLRPWQMRWQVVIGCCRTLQMEARTLESATNAAAAYWPMIYGGKPPPATPPERTPGYDVDCGHCGGPLWLMNVSERDIGMPDDPSKIKVRIGCSGCCTSLSGTGLTEPAATEEALRRWKDRNTGLTTQEPA